jgi:hypothetical protein
LIERGAECLVFPHEGDFQTVTALARRGLAPWLEVILYSYVPLFVSRAAIRGKGKREVTDRFGERFVVQRRDGLTHVTGRRPHCIFSYRPKLKELGIRHFRVVIPSGFFASADLPRLVTHYERCKDVSGGTLFNFERGLK